MKKIFIDGSAGTTGLRIYQRLSSRKDIELVTLTGDERKNPECRKKAINQSDITFLCLPDDGAREAVSFIENPSVVVIDASTAHRTESGWTYGFPELNKELAKALPNAKRIAVPGCHASGVIALVAPLIDSGVLNKNSLLSATSVTGYSGGGKKMIAEYESQEKDALLDFPRQYALTQQHKHLKEISFYTGLNKAPAFSPIVAPFYSGMEVTIPIFIDNLNAGCTKKDVEEVLKQRYSSNIVFYKDQNEEGFLSAGLLSGKDSMQISVFGNEERMLLCARYDNLGKGASGAAVQCLNVVLGLQPEFGLEL